MNNLKIDRLRLATPPDLVASVYARIFGRAVETMPMPQGRLGPLRSRAGANPVTISVLGHQRPVEKGYQLVPQIFSELVSVYSNVRLLIHNSMPAHMPAEGIAMRRLAGSESRVEVHEGELDVIGWEKILGRSDLVLCPYPPAAYRLISSGLLSEVIANGIPAVVPDGTALSRMLVEYGSPGTTFGQFDVPHVVEAVKRAIDRFNVLATIAYEAAERWGRENGPGAVVDFILAGS